MQHPPLQPMVPAAANPPRCLSCAYVLEGLHDPRCPECGRPFDFHDPSTWTTKPPYLAWKFWMPGFALAVIGSLIGAVILLFMGNWGWSLWFAVTFAAGSLLGYRVRSGWVVLVLLALAMVVSMIVGLMAMNVAGVFCGMALACILLGPIFVGTILGATLRHILKLSNFSHRSHLPSILFLLAPLICCLIEGPPRAHLPPESISTAIIIPAPIDACWNAIMFYEEVTHQPPLILRIGLAHPLSTRGSSAAVGDVKSCVYNKGVITKQITQVQPNRLLAFDVIQQHIGYERDVRLINGSFAFNAIDATHTSVTLTTRYEPLLRPRWCWQPFERFAVHNLHEHVIEGMRLKAAEAHSDSVVSAGASTAHLNR